MIYQNNDIAVFNHHLYEYEKGLRRLILHTVNPKYLSIMTLRLSRRNVDYYIQIISAKKANIFFGDDECIQIIKSFKDKKLSDLSPEQDFILGTMLGYCRIQQCKRYLKQCEKWGNVHRQQQRTTTATTARQTA